MDSVLFLAELDKKKHSYFKVWFSIFKQLNRGENAKIKLIVPPDINRITFKRIIDYGFKISQNYDLGYTLELSKKEIVFTLNTLPKKLKKQVEPKVVEVQIKPELQPEVLETIEVVEIPEEQPIIEEVKTVEDDPTPQEKSKKKTAKKSDLNAEIISQVIDYLNEQSGKNYKPDSNNAINFINARLKEKYKLEDFFNVIDIKVSKWKNTPMETFLRPETIFGTKFDSYLNETPLEPLKSKQAKNYDTAIEATKLGFNRNQTATQHN